MSSADCDVIDLTKNLSSKKRNLDHEDSSDYGRKVAARVVDLTWSDEEEDRKLPAKPKHALKDPPSTKISSDDKDLNPFDVARVASPQGGSSSSLAVAAAMAAVAAGPGATSSQSSSVHDDYILALALQNQEQEIHEQLKQREEIGMVASHTGKAWKFVEKVLAITSAVSDQTVAAVAVDDMVFLTERFLEAQERLAAAAPVDIGFHYTRSENLSRIKTDGLMSKQEREASNITSNYNGSAYGDGIYCATSPFAYSAFGDTGLMVARLKGIEDDHPATNRNANSTVVKRGTPMEFVVLKNSFQCVPLVRFSASTMTRHSNSTESSNTTVIFDLHVKLQNLLDAFFNADVPTTVQSWKGLQSNIPVSVRIFTGNGSRIQMQQQLQHHKLSQSAAANTSMLTSQMGGTSTQPLGLSLIPSVAADTAGTVRTTNTDPGTTAQQRARQEQEAQRRKEKYLMLIRVLLKYLEQKDPIMHARAKAVIRECAQKNKNKEAGYQSVTASMQTRLRLTVGDQYWKMAEKYLNCFLNQKKSKLEDAKRQPKQMQTKMNNATKTLAASREKLKQLKKQNAKLKKAMDKSGTLQRASINVGTNAEATSTNTVGTPLPLSLISGASGGPSSTSLVSTVPGNGTGGSTVGATALLNPSSAATSLNLQFPSQSTAAVGPSQVSHSAVAMSRSTGNRDTINYVAPDSLASSAEDVFTVVFKTTHTRLQEECPLCLDTFAHHGKVVRLRACGHYFHRSCMEDALKHSSLCPTCRRPSSKPQGKMPSGSMVVTRSRRSCSGYEPVGSIIITYSISSGQQKQYHPNPGQRHGSAHRTAYLPDNVEGNALLKRLKYAFQHGHTFTVGTSLTTGASNCVTWSSIHQKTSMSGGPHGFPDTNFIQNCNAELDSLHVPADQELL